MKISPNGEQLIETFEAFREHAYQDQKGVWTIGYGHTLGVKQGDICDQAQADAWLEQDTAAAVLAVNRSLDVCLNQNQFDALVSFTFNLGASSEAHSTLLKYVNQGQLFLAAAEFPRWNHCDGLVDAGLTRRRAAEQKLFGTPV
jgi:lysozyme